VSGLTGPRLIAVSLVALGAITLVALAIVSRTEAHGVSPTQARTDGSVGCSEANNAFMSHEDGDWITIAGRVSEIMSDAHGTSTHQRFVITCSKTVLIENNIDVGQRAPVSVGDRVIAHGQYIWNGLGGLIHDTHHASSPGTPDGWIYLDGRVYQ
jgi:hypothetical protein